MALKSYFNQWCKLLLLVLFLTGGVVTAQTHPKLKKDGKYKAKNNKPADHQHKKDEKKKHHSVDWNKHSKAENETFSKKKMKKSK